MSLDVGDELLVRLGVRKLPLGLAGLLAELILQLDDRLDALWPASIASQDLVFAQLRWRQPRPSGRRRTCPPA